MLVLSLAAAQIKTGLRRGVINIRFFFFFNDTATTEIYTLSLHDALPICWFNNFNNTSSDWQNRNQFGGRLGGPLVKNKTFFFFLIDEQRFFDKENFVGTVLTDQARQGNFRYFPGVDARNAQQLSATVDRNGNPILIADPATPTSINLFSYDPNRTGNDPTGSI